MRRALLVLALLGCVPHRTTLALTHPITPARFNLLAQRRDQPLFWRDVDGDGVVASDEVHALLFHGVPGDGTPEPSWVEHGELTPALRAAIDEIVLEDAAPAPSDVRRALVRDRLDHGEPDLIETDATQWSEADREFLRRMIVATDRIDALFSRQGGLETLRPRLDATDTISRAYFRTAWSPQCPPSADPRCSAIEGAPRPILDVWPPEVQDGTDGFCAAMLAESELRSVVTVVRDGPNGLHGIPYDEAYRDLARPAAEAFRHAADALGADDAVAAEYLRAVASELGDMSHVSSFGIASRMTAAASDWFVDAGYGRSAWEPCHRKASFHLTLGRFDHVAAAHAERVVSHASELSLALRALSPSVQPEHASALRVNDFVRIVLLGGEDRSRPLDGLSLRGRSMVYTNLSASEDEARRVMRGRARFLADPSWVQLTPERGDAARAIVALHETCHDLARGLEGAAMGAVRAHELLGVLREVYAETAARYLAVWLQAQHVLDAPEVDAMLRESIGYDSVWLGSRMYVRSGARRDAAQAAAVRLGMLVEAGVARWDPDAMSADGAHRGALVVDMDALRATSEALLRRVLALLATSDWAQLEDLVSRYVDHSPFPLAELQSRQDGQPYGQWVFSVRW